MNRKIRTIDLKNLQLLCCVAALTLAAFGTGAAQTKPRAAKPFSVPCAKALQIGADKVEALHDKEMQRRTKGNTDSSTESDATTGALKNYISCRRTDNAAKLETFSAADTKAEVKKQETAAKQLAKARFDGLIYGVIWDETGADSISYPMTLRAVALVEDYKGALVYSYSQDVEPDAAGAETRAARDEKLIQQMLLKMGNREFENQDDAADYQSKFAEFKVLVNQFLAENADRVATEKATAANFLVELLKHGAPEN